MTMTGTLANQKREDLRHALSHDPDHDLEKEGIHLEGEMIGGTAEMIGIEARDREEVLPTKEEETEGIVEIRGIGGAEVIRETGGTAGIQREETEVILEAEETEVVPEIGGDEALQETKSLETESPKVLPGVLQDPRVPRRKRVR